MSTASPAEPPGAVAHPVHLDRLISLRWFSVALMVLVAILAPVFGLAVPSGAIFVVVAALALWNLITPRVGASPAPRTFTILVELLVDLLGWSAFLYLTGGATNPMASLLLPLIAVGATLLPQRHAWSIAAMAIAAYIWLWFHHRPLILPDPSHGVLLHLAGMEATFAVSAMVIAWYVARMTQAVRSRDKALADAREQALRNERIMALANLAAGAAHELGTPLGTIRLLVTELQRDIQSTPLREDLALVDQQVEQCKRILSRLTEAAGRARAEDATRQPICDWLDELVRTVQAQRPGSRFEWSGPRCDAVVAVDVALAQALHNLLTNALKAAPTAPVELAVEPRADMVDLRISDRGAGLPAGLMDAANHPLHRSQLPGEGLGIGLLLSVAAIEHRGGSLEYRPRAGGGTVATITLPATLP